MTRAQLQRLLMHAEIAVEAALIAGLFVASTFLGAWMAGVL